MVSLLAAFKMCIRLEYDAQCSGTVTAIPAVETVLPDPELLYPSLTKKEIWCGQTTNGR